MLTSKRAGWLRVGMWLSVASMRVAHAEETPPQAETEAGQAVLAAVHSQQQVPSIRGGTLGIPSPEAAKGLQAMASSVVGEAGDAIPETLDFDLFLKLGGVQPSRWLQIDIVAEAYRADTPRVDRAARPLLPVLAPSELRSVGMRLRFTRHRHYAIERFLVDATGEPEAQSKLLDGESSYSATLGLRFLERPDTGAGLDFTGIAYEAIVQYSRVVVEVAPTCVAAGALVALTAPADLATAQAQLAALKAAAKARRAAAADVEKQVAAAGSADQGAAVAAKARDAADLVAVSEGEVAAQQRAIATLAKRTADAKSDKCERPTGTRWMAFAGVSGSVLHSRVMQDATMSIEEPLVKEVKLTLGAEIQTTGIVRGAKLLPRFGVYTALTRNDWQHRFTTGAPKPIEGFQWEAAAYVSGHFISGLNALVSIGVLRPYGHDRGIAGVINVAPAIGAVLGGS